MEARSRRLVFVCLLALTSICGLQGFADGQRSSRYLGRRLSSVLDELKSVGLPILYSDAVVLPGMTVGREPTAADPLALLVEILDPHALTVRTLEDGQLVVVPKQERTGTLIVHVELPKHLQSAPPAVMIRALRVDQVVDRDGVAVLPDVPAGSHELHVEAPGFLPRDMKVDVPARGTRRVMVRLRPMFHLEQIVVTPAHVSLRSQRIAGQVELSAEGIESMPHAGDDLMRAVSATPGLVQSDLSAQFNPRGGGESETLVLLDGVELYEPYHLKDFLSLFSIVDSKAVGQVDLFTGAFTAEYGDRMSAVMDISVIGSPGNENEVTLGTLSSRLFSTGQFGGDRGQWLVTARGWYPSELPDSAGFIEGELAADYYDVLARVRHPIGGRAFATIGLLGAYDDLSFREEDEMDLEWIDARYESRQSWLALEGFVTDQVLWQATASLTEIHRSRRGEEHDAEDGVLTVAEARDFESVDARGDWSWTFDDRHFLKWGVGIKSQNAGYDYARNRLARDDSPVETTNLSLDPEGTGYLAYVSDRFRVGSRFVVELGARLDHQDWLSDSQISPRVNVKFDLGPRTEARLGWGRFHQSQRINELQIEDGQTRFHEAEMSVHRVIGLAHQFENDWTIQTVLYEKDLEQLRPRYENLFSRLELFPESRDDRVLVAPERGETRGLEVVLRNAVTPRASWWVGYTLAEAEDVIDGVRVPRSWDQRHTVDGGLAFDLPWDVALSLGGTWHSGRPTTGVAIEWDEEDGGGEPTISPLARNQERLPNYLRLDLRVSRAFDLPWGTGEAILDVFNVTNHGNTCFIEDFVVERTDGETRLIPEEQGCSPFFPTFALRWRF